MTGSRGAIVALCGGVGGAKLAYGLNRVLGDRLVVIVNTGDDFEHLGLHVSPDVDTVLYTLGEQADQERGWGRAQETWSFMDAIAGLGGDTWFQLGDRDLAMHVLRTQALRSGQSLSEFTRSVASRLGIAAQILPMSDAPFRTIVVTPEGPLPFQRYFVEQKSRPEVKAIQFDGPASVEASDAVVDAIESASGIVICPSNPYLSIAPLLAVPRLGSALESSRALKIAVSPIVGGQAIKGPTVKIMKELGVSANNVSIARLYPFLDGLVLDRIDEKDAPLVGMPTYVTDTVMRSSDQRVTLASECLKFLERLRN